MDGSHLRAYVHTRHRYSMGIRRDVDRARSRFVSWMVRSWTVVVVVLEVGASVNVSEASSGKNLSRPAVMANGLCVVWC